MIERLRTSFGKVLAHQGFRKYFANTSWLFAEQILRIIAGLLVGIYVARYLGPEQFGLFSYALAFVALFASVAKLGMDGIIVRDLVNAPEKRDAYLGTAFWLKVMGAILAGAGIAVALTIAENDPTTNLYIGIIASGLVFQSFEVVDFYFQSRVLSKYVSICKISQLLLSSLLKLYFVAINADLFWFVLVSIVDQASLAVALAYAYSRQKLGAFYFKFDRAVAKELLVSARPLIISGVMVSVYSSVDRVIIKEMLGVREVGVYVAAASLTGAMSFLPTIVSNSVFPAILNAKQKSLESYAGLLIALSKSLTLLGILICLLVTLFADSIVHLLYGSQYVDAAGILQIYVWSFLLICFASIFSKWLLAENLQYLNFRFTVVALVINLLGNIILIPLFSVKGAAIASIAAQFIPFPLMLLLDKRLSKHLRDLLRARYPSNEPNARQ
jgi:O-antigen/teichoic acid export membrane protein